MNKGQEEKADSFSSVDHLSSLCHMATSSCKRDWLFKYSFPGTPQHRKAMEEGAVESVNL